MVSPTKTDGVYYFVNKGYDGLMTELYLRLVINKNWTSAFLTAMMLFQQAVRIRKVLRAIEKCGLLPQEEI